MTSFYVLFLFGEYSPVAIAIVSGVHSRRDTLSNTRRPVLDKVTTRSRSSVARAACRIGIQGLCLLIALMGAGRRRGGDDKMKRCDTFAILGNRRKYVNDQRATRSRRIVMVFVEVFELNA